VSGHAQEGMRGCLAGGATFIPLPEIIVSLSLVPKPFFKVSAAQIGCSIPIAI
jgi:hypothetical protein